ncbi:hypothetical protein [Vibrio agarivorans]|uniref:Uncharacterized protein n=1 Tax=Vibrio agarivorans TaxID=153622 RepID=A0ABT7Y7B6_9VIBR|nr:hypothetical protein [Vibrio agarivorans]MDN2483958.1 hypothetical protein [Vibrio agarivorans]
MLFSFGLNVLREYLSSIDSHDKDTLTPFINSASGVYNYQRMHVIRK